MEKNLVYIIVKGFECPLDEITKILNLEPTGGGLAGETMGKKTKIIRKISTWDLKSSLAEELPVTQHVDALLSVVENRKSELLTLTKKYEGELFVAKYNNNEFNTVVHLRKDQIQELAALNLELIVDIYRI